MKKIKYYKDEIINVKNSKQTYIENRKILQNKLNIVNSCFYITYITKHIKKIKKN